MTRSHSNIFGKVITNEQNTKNIMNLAPGKPYKFKNKRTYDFEGRCTKNKIDYGVLEERHYMI